jgi:hypothetical protein
MLMSSSLCRYTREDSSKVYFSFFGVVIHFLGTRTHCGPRPRPVGPAGEAAHCTLWACARMTTWWRARQRHCSRRLAARCSRGARVGPRGGARQCSGRRGSPGKRVDSEGEEKWWLIDVPRRRWNPAAGGG